MAGGKRRATCGGTATAKAKAKVKVPAVEHSLVTFAISNGVGPRSYGTP